MKYREYLKCLALGMTDSARAIRAKLDDEDPGDLVAATFTVCVTNRFKEDDSAEAVHRFVEEAYRDFSGPETVFKPLVAEALIRVVVDPDHSLYLLEEVDGSDHIPTQIPLIRKMVAESAAMTDNIDKILDTAEEVAAMWAEDHDE